MNCQEARAAMVEVSVAAFDEGDLGSHLQRCESCAAAASTMRAEEERLRRVMDRVAGSMDVEAILEGVYTRLKQAETTAGRYSLPMAWRRAVPVVAMAAALGALALWGLNASRAVNPTTIPGGARAAAVSHPLDEVRPAEDLGVESTQRFALMKTDKPTISVVWFY